MFDVSASVFLGPCGTKGLVYLAVVRKQAERRAGGFNRGLVHFPTLADRKQAMTTTPPRGPRSPVRGAIELRGRKRLYSPPPINIPAFQE